MTVACGEVSTNDLREPDPEPLADDDRTAHDEEWEAGAEEVVVYGGVPVDADKMEDERRQQQWRWDQASYRQVRLELAGLFITVSVTAPGPVSRREVSPEELKRCIGCSMNRVIDRELRVVSVVSRILRFVGCLSAF